MNASLLRPAPLCVLAGGLFSITLAGCGHPGTSPVDKVAAPDSAAPIPAGKLVLTVPKVPFGNQPCQSLSPTEQKDLEQAAWGYSTPVPGTPDRAPAGLPHPNVCAYYQFSVGYMTQPDYQTNRDGNHSTSRADPPGLPGAFYNKQGGLWFSKNGYYVVIEGDHKVDVAAARTIAAKL